MTALAPRFFVVALGVLAACTPTAVVIDGAPLADDVSACAPDRIGLAAARPMPAWLPPEGCTRANHAGRTITIRSEGELRAGYTCPEGVDFGIDFSRDHLVLSDRMASPAQVGTDVYDDGATVTFVDRQRTNCPDDLQPMPMAFTVGFLLPASATDRNYAEAICTVRRGCR